MAMARSERARSAGHRADTGLLRSAFVREAVGVGLLGLALFAAIALWSYGPGDPLWSGDRVANRAGRLGALLAAGVFGGIGVAGHLWVAGLAVFGGRPRARGRVPRPPWPG